jgi:predicted component of type VI protein secretion system
MSKDEEIQMRGQILTNFIEARSRLTALQQKADHYSEVLNNIIRWLQSTEIGTVYDVTPYGGGDYPSLETLKQFFTERQQVEQQRHNAEEQLRRLGIEIK